jgi:hypothetical protein
MAQEKTTTAPESIGTAKLSDEDKELVSKALKTNKGAELISLDDIVKFEVNYPKDYKGNMGHKQGSVIELHRVTALQFQDDKKIGKIVE